MRRTYDERQRKKQFKMDIVNRIKDLTPQDRQKTINMILCERHKIPYSRNDNLSRTTVYRWLKEHRENKNAGTALMTKVRSDIEIFKVLTGDQKDALKRWRYDGPYRSLRDLREELMQHISTISDPMPSESTIGRYLNSQGLSRSALIMGMSPHVKIRSAFEAEYPQQLWMADTKGPDVYVDDPKNPGRKVVAKPIALIDDNSRYLVMVMYVLVENEYAVMELFRRAILLFGIPEMLYLDRGSPYMGKSLARAASLIGCNIIHTKKEDPSAKGKIEKMLRTIHERFEHEMMASGKDSCTLDEYNAYLQAYVGQDYHRRIHSSTKQSPEERFFSLPADMRRWISKDNLSLIFLPVRKVSVTKVGLVHINNLKYLVPDASLWNKKVDVRFEYFDKSKVYVWSNDKYYGEAFVFTQENDFIKRQEITSKIITVPEITLPDIKDIPIYGRLDRQLAMHREEMESMDMNRQLSYNKQKKDDVRAMLIKKSSENDPHKLTNTGTFEADEFIYLLMKLLKRKFTPSERLSVHTLWNSVGPIDEKLVRSTVGRLLGEEYPTDDLTGYLEEIRITMITTIKN